MAQSWRVRRRSPSKPRPPLDAAKLEALALHYVGRYATTRAKLRAYLKRKLAERGWDGDAPAAIEPLVAKLAGLGYVDDRAFASSRATSLARRGYGARRLDLALRVAGIEEDDGEDARRIAADAAWDSAEIYARKRRLGPFAEQRAERAAREKALAAMVRAGHPFDIARRFVSADPGVMPERDS